MMARHSTKRRPRVVGVISSRADLEQALRMRSPPDLFELRLDRLAGMADQLEKRPTQAAHAAHHHSATPERRRQRQIVTAATACVAQSVFNYADYLDVELRSARALRALLVIAKTKNVRRIISFHNFKSTPRARTLATRAGEAKSQGADIFKVATRTDTPMELGRLVEFMTSNRLDLAVAVMGIGKLGAISRVLLARSGSVLIYASVGAATNVEGQMSLEQLRASGFGP
jgi:3-dehydroquinate dehydratase